MRVVTCPDNYVRLDTISVFLAGGITGTAVWQDRFIELVGDMTNEHPHLVLINPRRKHYDGLQPGIEEDQITWEWKHVKASDVVSFWFPPETLCPIALFELGKEIMARRRQIFVGCHPEYGRKADLLIQLRLERPDIELVYSLEDLARQISKKVLSP